MLSVCLSSSLLIIVSYFFAILLFLSLFLLKLAAFWYGIEHILGTSNQNLNKENEEVKKANEEVEDMKKKLIDKNSLIKLKLDRMSKLK